MASGYAVLTLLLVAAATALAVRPPPRLDVAPGRTTRHSRVGLRHVAVSALSRMPSAARRRRERELVLQTPQVLDLLAAALSAGLPLRNATAAVVRASPGAVADALATVLKQTDLGVSEVEAWRSLREHAQLGAVAADLARSVESGTMLAAALAVHADEARDLRTAAVEVAARKVGVRSVLPLMLCFIPAFLLLGIVPTLVSAVLAALAPG